MATFFPASGGVASSAVQQATYIYAADTGAANAYAATYTPAIASLTVGMILTFKATNANTLASTFAPNGLTAQAIKKDGTTALAANDILAGQLVLVEWDGTNWQMQSQLGNVALSNPMTTLGDLIYGGTAGAGTRLAGDTSNTRKFLRELSAAGVAAAPVFDTLLAADVPSLDAAKIATGVLPSTVGGTGNGFAKLSGPATTEKTLTIPNANAVALTDQAAEINALTSKATPVSADLLVIEDSAAANAKKKVTIGSLPAAAPASLASSRAWMHGGANFTDNTNAFVDVTNATATITTGAHKVLVLVNLQISGSVAGQNAGFDIMVDGVSESVADGLYWTQGNPTAGNGWAISFTWITSVLTAASHTIKLRAKSGGQTLTIYQLNASAASSNFSVVELYD